MKLSSTRPKGSSATKSSKSATHDSSDPQTSFALGEGSELAPRTGAEPKSAPAKAAKKAATSPAKKTAPEFSSGSQTPVQFVKGVGPRLASIFQSRGIEIVRDLLYFFPRAYEDRTRVLRVTELQPGVKSTVSLRVLSSRKIPTRGYGKNLFEVRATDDTAVITLKWFYLPRGMDSKFIAGSQFLATGTPKEFRGMLEIIHPEISWGKTADLATTPTSPTGEVDPLHSGRVVPIYTEIEGLASRLLRKILWDALSKYAPFLTEDIPARFVARHQLPRIAEAVLDIHFPKSASDNDQAIQELIDFRTPSHARLIYEEFFKFEFLVLRQRLQMEKENALSLGLQGGRKAVEDLSRLLPFKLTGDQMKAVDEILADLTATHPMNRLVQGDVGSGKTAVAFLCAAAALAEGSQVALMAPTEILAEQHFKNADKLFGGRLPVALLTGRTTNAERTTLLTKLAAGQPLLVIGTHALIEEPVIFKSLALVMIDEQHRFGVEQRRIFRRKGIHHSETTNSIVHPHFLILTATPIPRTLALTAYGDLAVSMIRELPPGRSPIATKVIRGTGRSGALERVRTELGAGRQAYFIYPLVNESEAEGFQSLRSATVEAERLQKEVYPEFKVGLLHGQMKSDEKNEIMAAFKENRLQILVSTTVVEVGVDVPNATVMCVDHAERFGLSQLHQLRGRVGRGIHPSFCFYFTGSNSTEQTQARLEVLEETNDGFEIAEADLRIRGPGEFLGTRQAGGLPFKLADLVRDREWLFRAREDALELLKSDPDLTLADHSPLRNFFEREGKLQGDRLKTS
ncbi:MAG: ATP-dependent DNA helicase RecG [Cryobacterium sp.]|nr:ATP-dependent DNA helicase RecG [Oligoflexia bacterium]